MPQMKIDGLGRKTRAQVKPNTGVDIQSKFFQLLAGRTEGVTKGIAKPFELVVRGDWANTGHGYIQRKNTFDTVSNFHYDFQNGYASFVINGARVHAEYILKPGSNSRTLDQVIDQILEPTK